MDEQDIQQARRRPFFRGRRIAVAAVLIVLIGAFVIVWSIRVRLATDYIDRELARRGVQASYEVKRIGFGTQVLENLVIGDPARPDATVRELRLRIRLGLTGPSVGLITARGVRMRGRIVDGRLTLGQIDRLLPPPSGLPFRLPDQRVDVRDAAILLDTPAGRLALGLEGRGNLADGFRGRLALASRGLRLGECAVREPSGDVAVAVADLRPHFEGPVAMAAVRCGDDLAVDRPQFALDATLDPAFDAWRGDAAVRAARFAAGPQYLERLQGRLTYHGNAEETRGRIDLASAGAAVDAFRARRARFAGLYSVSPRRGDLALVGDVGIEGLALSTAGLAGLAGPLRSFGGTPLDPIGEVLAVALERASRGGGDAAAAVRLVNRSGAGAIRFEQLRLATRSGAELAGDSLTYRWPDGQMQLEGRFALSGGGFPDARFSLSQPRPGGAVEGVGRIAPMAAGGARLAFQEIRFAARPDGRTRFATAVRIDGPLSGGRIAGLVLPVSGRFGPDGLAIGEGCVAGAFQSLQIEGLRIGPSRLPLCPVGRAMVWQRPGGSVRVGAELRGARFAGRLGQSPIVLAADRVRVDSDGFTAAALAARLGPASSVTRVDVASLSGRFVARGVQGRYAGLEGKIANVPLLLSEGEGAWQVARGDVLIEGPLLVSDEMEPARFFPLRSEDFRLTLIDNRIHATGWLHHRPTGTRIARATVDHNLRSGAGEAVLDVPGIVFAEGGLQPEQITRLTTGVVALVDGTLSGQGRIAWDAEGTRSTGTFSTEGMNLAAPFGPVENLTTTIEFTDLLGLASAPRQTARVGLIRAGIDVYDGIVAYQLLPGYRVQVESGHWPFAGGELSLEPTLLDFSRPTTKYLTFRVVGMDAARFIQQMEFSNISATGTFDGVVPMRFGRADETGRILGGEIVDGRLVARPPGGTLSYVGELTDRDLGPYGILAFNALKSLRYDRFEITLNGALDGEFITVIDLDGIARDPTLTTLPSGGGIGQIVAGRVLRQVARLPFEFNIRIEGRFRALIATARSFSDPSNLLQAVLPGMLRERAATTTVQDEESENEP